MSEKNHTFSLENYVDKALQDKTAEEIAKAHAKGFVAYQFTESIFLKLEMDTYVKTTCPINGTEDIIKLHIEYTTNREGLLIEHHSFIDWLNTFKDLGYGLEATVNAVYLQIDKAVDPTTLKVVANSHSNFRSFNKATREKTF